MIIREKINGLTYERLSSIDDAKSVLDKFAEILEQPRSQRTNLSPQECGDILAAYNTYAAAGLRHAGLDNALDKEEAGD